MREMILQTEERGLCHSIRCTFHFPEFIFLWRELEKEGERERITERK